METLLPFFIEVFIKAALERPFHKDILTATIATVPKPGKESNITAYSLPISLLNTDIKLYAKVTSNRLFHLIPEIINADQVGLCFIDRRKLTPGSSFI